MMFYLWGHSYEFEEKNNWDVIEEFMKYVANRDDVWYATNMEIFEYEQAFKSLIFDINLKRCINPTAFDIWFNYNNKDYFIKKGETLRLD